MTVMNKVEYERIIGEYQSRQRALASFIQQRPLRSSSEGCAKGHWGRPEELVAFVGSESEIRMALADLGAVLKELEKLVR